MMKNLNIKIWAGAMAIILLVSSCDDFLDINTNPNAATTADVQLVLPHAIVATANISSQFNTYGSHLVGYIGLMQVDFQVLEFY
jgi:protein involved in sex pheromone biosynthesis